WDGFAKLEQLKISDCPAVPLHMLQRKPNIERLSVRNAAIEGAARIASLQRLDQLSLIRCTVDDWAFLQSLPAKLSTLTLASCNGPETLALIKDLETLKALVLENALVTDIAPLTGMKLDTVSLYGCAIADYTPLQTLPSLKRLYCSQGAALPTLHCRIVFNPLISAE
ncbi:MAG: hypothetical protein IH607_03005, partial [Firmicutes bacterium]|nr:hypothetical protein [Bacillota bacterium]